MSIVTTSSRKRSRRRPILPIAAIALLIFAAFVAYFLFREGRAPARPHEDTTARDGGRAAGASQQPVEHDGSTPGESAMQNAESTMHNGGALGETALPEAAEPPNLPTSSPSTNEASSAEPPLKPPKHFRSPSEQLLAMMLSTPPEVAMPPLPQLDPDGARLNADALSAVTNDLVIYDTDGERLERLKEDVAGAKFQLADAVAKGVSVAEALNEFRAHQNEGVEIRNETIKAINSIEDDQAAIETFKKANEELVKEDIAPIKPEEVGLAAEDDETDR